MDLTDRQRRLYGVILAAATAGQVCPTNREIAVQSGLVSASAVADALGRLQRKGVVEVTRYNRARVVKFPGLGVETKRPPAASSAGYAPHWQYRKSNSEGLDKAVPKESVLPLRPVCGAFRTVPTWRPSRCQFFIGPTELGEEGKCGAKVRFASAYCAGHHDLCYRRVPSQPRSRVGAAVERHEALERSLLEHGLLEGTLASGDEDHGWLGEPIAESEHSDQLMHGVEASLASRGTARDRSEFA